MANLVGLANFKQINKGRRVHTACFDAAQSLPSYQLLIEHDHGGRIWRGYTIVYIGLMRIEEFADCINKHTHVKLSQ
jgi:hypothetical protein